MMQNDDEMTEFTAYENGEKIQISLKNLKLIYK